jgi:hypothetical protein
MFFKCHKSRTVAIIKSLLTSPLAFVIYVISGAMLISILSYCFHQLNVYLLNKQILPKVGKDNETIEFYAFLWCFIEISAALILIGICILFYETVLKAKKDIEIYELQSITWQK